jgi:hypothetical protein
VLEGERGRALELVKGLDMTWKLANLNMWIVVAIIKCVIDSCTCVISVSRTYPIYIKSQWLRL